MKTNSKILDETLKLQVLSERQAADYLKVSRYTLLRLRKANKISFFRVGGQIRYKLSTLVSFSNESAA